MDMYGIKNCDTVKKARKFLDTKNIDYQFHDFKTEGVTKAQINRWLTQTDWETLLNRRGTTWRRLADNIKADINKTKAIALMLENPSIIKRPVLEAKGKLLVGFDETLYNTLK